MLTRRLLPALAAASILAASLPPALAEGADAAQATKLVQDLGAQLVAIVNGPGTIGAKQAKVAPLIERDVDVDGIARFCLGRFWRAATPPQQQAYVQAFHKVMLNSITTRLGEFQGVAFAMTQTVQREGATLVGTRITRPNQEPALVQWVVDGVDGQPKIVDLIAEGTSLRLTQRSDYGSFLSRNGGNVDALIAAMRRQVGA
ncbi:MAG: ABC transporter substrate-binding protein [Acetobacteraceae bacterium]|nr:ABC transporter substrate-binding protein [Acetobacteraceae bacterium]